MTARLLTPHRSGVYRAPESLGAARRSLGPEVAWIEVDLTGTSNKAQWLAAFATALHLPEGFGANWDALADALEDGSTLPGDAYVIHVGNGRASANPADWSTLVELLSDAASWWRARGKAFVVLIDDSDLPRWI